MLKPLKDAEMISFLLSVLLALAVVVVVGQSQRSPNNQLIDGQVLSVGDGDTLAVSNARGQNVTHIRKHNIFLFIGGIVRHDRLRLLSGWNTFQVN